MQLIRTQVSANSDRTTTVVFAGEGNEEVSVRLSATDLDCDDAVLRAKAVMVQLTQFEISPGDAGAGNERDTHSISPGVAPDGVESVSGMGRIFPNGDTDRNG